MKKKLKKKVLHLGLASLTIIMASVMFFNGRLMKGSRPKSGGVSINIEFAQGDQSEYLQCIADNDCNSIDGDTLDGQIEFLECLQSCMQYVDTSELSISRDLGPSTPAAPMRSAPARRSARFRR